MAVTPNYSWPVPVNTDYVKDGAEAIKDLGDAIDATVFGLPSGALTLVKTQVIGTAVTSVTVTGAFSATYDAYKVVISGGANTTNADAFLRIGGVDAGYYFQYIYTNWGNTLLADASAGGASAIQYAGNATTSGLYANIEINSPFLNKNTFVQAFGGGSFQSYVGNTNGLLGNSNSYTSFSWHSGSGTMTGGTVSVYGYAK